MMPFGRNLSLPLVVAVFALTASHATAQAYKCDTPSGTVYSQIPCAPDAQKLFERSSPRGQPSPGVSGPRPSTSRNQTKTMGVSPSVGSAGGITGFRDFQFGMSLSEARAIDTLTFAGRDRRGFLYDARRMVTILGGDYNQSLVFNDEKGLTMMKLKRRSAADRTRCWKEFAEVYWSARARYRPNLPIEDEPAKISSAEFNQVDGSKLIVSTNFSPGHCEIQFVYRSARGGPR